MLIFLSRKIKTKFTIAMSSYNASFQCSPGFTLLAANWTNLKTVQMGLNVMFHFSLIFVGSLTNLTAVHNPFPMLSNKPSHSFVNFFLQIRKPLS